MKSITQRKQRQMINNDTIKLIQSSESFQMNSATLANTLHTTKQDAGQEILIELYTNRLDDNITEVDSKVSRDITFARKDVERAYYKELKEQQEHEVDYDATLMENLAELVSTNSYLKDYDIDNDKFNLIVSLFHSTQQAFVARLLLTGEESTMNFFDDSQKTFNRKLSRVENYARTHQGKFRSKLLVPYDLELQAMSDAIDEFFNLYDSEFVSNKQVKDYFVSHQDMYPFAEALDKVHYQGLLFDDWRGYTERTDFLLELNYQQQVLLDQIAVRKAERGY